MKKNGLRSRPVFKRKTICFPAMAKPAPAPRPQRRRFQWAFPFLLAAWTFVLGIYVGRTTEPVYPNGVTFESQLAALEAAELEAERSALKQGAERTAGVELDFYDALRKEKSYLQETAVSSDPPEPQGSVAVKRALSKKNIEREGEDGIQVAALAAPLPEALPAATERAVPPSDGAFAIQVASFGIPDDADKMVSSLKARGFGGAYLAEEQVSGMGVRYRVKIGSFSDREGANRTLARLKGQAQFKDAYIFKKKN